ncbi:MAG: capsule biosynthesis GfcC family protein [Rhodanobacter sp.]
MQVEVSGAVAATSPQMLKDGARLSDAALAAQPSAQAYMVGAAWLRPSLLVSQERLKAGVLFDLSSLQQRARQREKPDMAALAERLASAIKAMPVTGRRTAALIDPRAVEVNAPENHPVAAGDKLYYPLRPTTVRIVGAVQQVCQLPLVPLQDAVRYLASCVVAAEADRDTIYVIEPDGRVFVQGIALWNRTAPIVLAPGAVVYVPFRASAAKKIDPALNSDVAAFLATQLLPGPGAQ